MSVLATPAVAPFPVQIPIRQVLPWAILTIALGLVMLYFVGTEQGALAMFSGESVHEFVHDARHLLGFPCH
jgi:cobalt transporter subunit CbtB